ncbi:Golgi-associated olfactory signaling regulator [Xenopus laevis]|nr:Golgi-associated olfactory signaling regulator [Xenopus laevis]
MDDRRKMRVRGLCTVIFTAVLAWCLEITGAEVTLTPSKANVTIDGSATNFPPVEFTKGNTDLKEKSNKSVSTNDFDSTQSPLNFSRAYTLGDAQNSSEVGATIDTSLNTSLTDGVKFLQENHSTTELTTPEKQEKSNAFCVLLYKIWNHGKLRNTSTDFFTQHGEEEYEARKDVGAHKLLAMFLGMAGVLACLLILIYCIYNRQHKEEMFSHRRLYGEGFEDPVLHLDTPMDHYDFFSFKDHDTTTPALTAQNMEDQKNPGYPSKGDYKVDVPKGTSSNEHLRQIFQLGPLKLM